MQTASTPTAPTTSKTTDGVTIVPGLKVWTTNIEVVTIVKPLFEERGVIWWAVDNGGMFDGGRLATVWNGKRADHNNQNGA